MNYNLIRWQNQKIKHIQQMARMEKNGILQCFIITPVNSWRIYAKFDDNIFVLTHIIFICRHCSAMSTLHYSLAFLLQWKSGVYSNEQNLHILYNWFNWFSEWTVDELSRILMITVMKSTRHITIISCIIFNRQ